MDQSSAKSSDSFDIARAVSLSGDAELAFARDLTVVACNEAYGRALDVPCEAMIGRSVREAFADGPALERLIASLETVRASCRPHWVSSPAPRPFNRRGGDAATPDFAMANMPVLGADGAVQWILHSLEAMPASPHRLALEAAEARLHSILQTVPDAMIIIDERGRIESLSTTAERLFGYSMAEVAGSNISLFMPSPDREQHDGYLKRYLSTGERRIIGIGRIVVGLRKDGSHFPMELSVGEALVEGERVFIGFIRDLTRMEEETRRAEALQKELIHVNRVSEMGQVVSNLAHEVSQPLAAIMNFAQAGGQMLASAPNPAPALGHVLARIEAQAERASEIIRRVRAFIDRREVERRPEELRVLIEEALGLALVGPSHRDVRINLDLAATPTIVDVDRIQIQQVLVNLIRNAADVLEGRPDKKIDIGFSVEDDVARVHVADNGPGVDETIAPRLFEAFVTTKEKGLGVGLSICRAIVESHGGRIWLEPNEPRGASFVFTLPREGAEA